MKRIFFILFTVTAIAHPLFPARKSVSGSQNQTAGTDSYWLGNGRLRSVFHNNGVWMHDLVADDWGLEWPRGSGLSPVYAAGQWIAAKFVDEIRVAGVLCRSNEHLPEKTEFQPGTVLAPGQAADPRDPAFRFYELKSEGDDDRAVWPVDQGAPVDAAGNPLLFGDRTIFCVYNDLTGHDVFGTEPLSVEVRQTAWVTDSATLLGDAVFMHWQIVNRSGLDWDSTYFSFWVDPDIGYRWDDLVGCDTTLDLGYAYNARNEDEYYGTAPPATGVVLLEGPLLEVMDEDMSSLSMTSFIIYFNDNSFNGNPTSGYDVWNYVRAYWRNGDKIIEDCCSCGPGAPVNFMFTGNPEYGEGWNDRHAGDRRFILSTGSFPLPAWEDTDGDGRAERGEPGVQAVTAAVLTARGDTWYNSVKMLREKTALLRELYREGYLSGEPVPLYRGEVEPSFNSFALGTNYPNPFNLTTAVRYLLPREERVRLTVYNIRGEKIRTLLDAVQEAGTHEAAWDGTDDAGRPVSTGVYLCVMEAGLYHATQKMVVVK